MYEITLNWICFSWESATVLPPKYNIYKQQNTFLFDASLVSSAAFFEAFDCEEWKSGDYP